MKSNLVPAHDTLPRYRLRSHDYYILLPNARLLIAAKDPGDEVGRLEMLLVKFNRRHGNIFPYNARSKQTLLSRLCGVCQGRSVREITQNLLNIIKDRYIRC